MLVLTRRSGESIVIGDDVRVVVLDSRGETVRLGIEAPRSVQVHRAEVYAEVQAANAAAVTSGDLGPLAGRLSRAARPRADAARDASASRARRMVRMSQSDGLDAVQQKIDDAKDAAASAEEDLLPRGGSSADPRSAEGGTFEPSGDDSDAGETPSEGRAAGTPGQA